MIQAEHLSKTYSIIDKEVGLKGSIKAFFKPKKKAIPAVQDISLQVGKGEIIGYMGKTGKTDRPQLHLQINSFINGAYKNGAENPLKYFTKLADKLGKSSLA